MLRFLILLLISSSAFAYGPSRRSCEFYKDLETRFSCGTKGYPLAFGYRMCEKYRKVEDHQFARIKRWFPEVRFCLQNNLYKHAHKAKNCHELKEMALNSHIGCYVSTGYCDLNAIEVASILYITGSDALNTDVVKLGSLISAVCLSQKGAGQF